MQVAGLLGLSLVLLATVTNCFAECIVQCPCSRALSRHPGDTNGSYFVCANGNPKRFQCGEGHRFHPASQTCVSQEINPGSILCPRKPQSCHMDDKHPIEGSGNGDPCFFASEGSGCNPHFAD